MVEFNDSNESNFIVKKTEVTNDDYGVYPNELSVFDLIEQGFVIVDKDTGSTSHQIADHVKDLVGCSKAGHSGTLDPKVTGVLVVGLGKGTRLMDYMLKSDKVYICLMYLHKEVSDSDLEDAFSKFTGKIMQLPPIVSAVKREEREREIYSMEILSKKDNNQFVLFKVSCQHGTYIRKLCSDMGEYLGVGAQMAELRRIKAGPFTEEDNSISLDKLRNLWELYDESNRDEKYHKELKNYIRPMGDLLKDFKKIFVSDAAIDSLSHGYDLAIPGIVKFEYGITNGEDVAIFSLKGELIAMGKSLMNSEEIKKLDKGICIKTNKVFMDVGVYPTTEVFKKLQNGK